MAKVYIHEDESIDEALHRFKKYVEKDGIINDYKKHTFFESELERKRQKQLNRRNRKSCRTRR